MTQQPILIVGAGIGGMATAIRLAAAGHPVTVFEQSDRPGGKMHLVESGGFRWDTGPSVITMRHVFEDLFAAAGRSLDDYLTLEPANPLTRYFYPDGTVLDATSDLAEMARQIERIEPKDVEGYLAYLAYAARIHRITGPQFIYGQPPTLTSMLLNTPIREWLQVDPLRTMQQAIESFVESPKLRQLLGRFATYVGSSPWQAPATLNVISHVELTGGVYYPRGGIYMIADAMFRLAHELGVQFELGCSVESILVKDGTVQGVQVNGEHIRSGTVVANVDVTTVYERLLPDGVAKTPELIEPSCSGYVMLLGVEGDYPELAHHNIFFSADYRREFTEIFKQGVPPSDPTVYVAITSKTDPDHALAGHENWFILVNAPALGPQFDWHSHRNAYRETVLGTLKRFGYDIADNIRAEHILTPIELAERSGAYRGALYGPSSNSAMSAFKRPHNRSPVKGLYFAGGTTHPGGGVPMVTLSGKVVADMILARTP